MSCFAPDCPMAGTKWAVILIGHAGPGSPYRLELPRPVCQVHQLEFQPAIFLTEASRDQFRRFARSWRTAEPDFDDISVEWLPIDQPTIAAMDGGAARFCAPVVV